MKFLLILFTLVFCSCQKDCYLIDNAGNYISLQEHSAEYHQYNSTGQTEFGGNTYIKSENDLHKICP